MSPLYLVNVVCIFFSIWVALSPRFRTDDQAGNWRMYKYNLLAAGIHVFILGFGAFVSYY